MKEAEIMLFGRNILLPEKGQGGEYSGESCVENSNGSGGGVDCDRCSDVNGGEEGGKGDVDDQEKQDRFDEDKPEEQLCETTEQDEDRNPGHTDESHNNPSSDSDNTTPKTSSTDDDTASENHPKPENEQTGSTSAQPKALPKPDKILPCPRCNSADTKFCYYNNYNVKQPRHFCKSCQRYWTVGGTMRNVPVGAGRRKQKNYASHFRHVTISEPLHAGSNTDGFCHVNLKPNSGVLSFGPDSPLACNVSLSEKGVPNRENGTQLPAMQNVNGFGSPFVSWPYHPAVCPPPGYPIPCYYAPPVWNCSVPPNPWNVPFVSGPTSPLGKHSRNGELLNANNPEGNDRRNSESSIVVPKTLRIDDPEEAAKSSIWSTLGIDYDSFSLLKALQPKGDDKKSTVANSPLLQANPAALSRSISFHERV